jgi:hypothetical protein
MSQAVAVEGISNVIRELERRLTVPVSDIERTLRDEARPLRDSIRAAAPQGETGNLRKGIVVRTGRRVDRKSANVYVKNNAPHAHLVGYGTKAHSIGMKAKKVMAAAGAIFGRKVNHPGSKPDDFFSETAEREMPGVSARSLEALKRLYEEAR